MCENTFGQVKQGLQYDDLRSQQKFSSYRLSRDKKVLEYLYGFRDQVSYVIYVYNNGVEFIKLDNIPELLKLLPWEFIVHPMDVINIESFYGISLPSQPMKAEEDIDE